MPIWTSMLLLFLDWFIKWIISDEAPLNEKQKRKVNGIIFKFRKAESLAVDRGATVGGIEEV